MLSVAGNSRRGERLVTDMLLRIAFIRFAPLELVELTAERRAETVNAVWTTGTFAWQRARGSWSSHAPDHLAGDSAKCGVLIAESSARHVRRFHRKATGARAVRNPPVLQVIVRRRPELGTGNRAGGQFGRRPEGVKSRPTSIAAFCVVKIKCRRSTLMHH